MNTYDNDTYFMKKALDIAGYALGRTSPNPLVGAVIVRDGRIIGQGWHRKAGEAHAEINALNQAGCLAEDATMYVNLEPCSHQGRTEPCIDALIAAGIKRVVIAMTDPNPLVSGKGIERLRSAGIDITVGKLAAEAAKLNEVFIKWITAKLPFVAIKTAMSLDGKIAAHTSHSKWITGEQARGFVHELRDKYDGILVGIGTLLADNPELTTRLPNSYCCSCGKNAVRIIVDSQARTPLTAKVVADGLAPTIIAVSDDASDEKITALKNKGVEVLTVKKSPNFNKKGIDLHGLLKQLGERGITSILVEGGSSINASFFEANLADKIYWFVAPTIIGGQNAPGPVGGIGVSAVDKAIVLEDIEVKRVGEDFLFSASIRQPL